MAIMFLKFGLSQGIIGMKLFKHLKEIKFKYNCVHKNTTIG